MRACPLHWPWWMFPLALTFAVPIGYGTGLLLAWLFPALVTR